MARSRDEALQPPVKRFMTAPPILSMRESFSDLGSSLAYVTDIEGNWEYLMSYVERSPALTLKSFRSDGSAELELEDGWSFMHGGDAVDKGGPVGGSVRVARTLVALKKAYPMRVTLILGNRDINKMRITSELADGELADDARSI